MEVLNSIATNLKYPLPLFHDAMNKKILAISVSAVLALAFVLPAINANALTSAENKALKTILGLTQQAKDKLANNVQPTLTTVKEDLKFKQKFWQFEPFPVFRKNIVGVAVESCELNDRSACAFNVESIQIKPLVLGGTNSQPSSNTAKFIIVDQVFADIPDVKAPTNLLVDTGIGQIGASDFVLVGAGGTSSDTFTATVEFNGEKPQGMELIRIGAVIIGPGEEKVSCFGPAGNEVQCPDKVRDAVEKAIDKLYG